MCLFIAVCLLAQCVGCEGEEEVAAPRNIPASTSNSSSTQWTQWTKRSTPVFSGQYGVASDPCIIRDGKIYRMYHTGLDVVKTRTIVCQATSSDGISWQYVSAGGKHKGMILRGRNDQWDENLESVAVVKNRDGFLLYFSGYRDKGNPMKGFPAALFAAKSKDGVNFSRVSTAPVLKPTPGWYDNDAIYSPCVIRHDGQYIMLYVGHCYTRYDKIKAPGVYLLAATSPDGIKWTKHPEPLMSPGSSISWMAEGAAEPSILAGSDGKFYLFFTGLRGEQRVIGVARSDSPLGRWQVNPDPILTPTRKNFDEHQVLAPFVILEGDKLRMWYLGVNKKERMVTGYAEADWPIYHPSK